MCVFNYVMRPANRALTFTIQTQLYEAVDWDDNLDAEDREAEERWFDNDD